MKVFSFTNFIILTFTVFLCNSVWVFYQLFRPEGCDISDSNSRCIKSIIHGKPKPKWNLKIYLQSNNKEKFSIDKSTLIVTWKKINFLEDFEQDLNITIPRETLNNGTASLHLFLYIVGESAFTGENSIHKKTDITSYSIPVSYFKLVNNNNTEDEGIGGLPVTHWRPKIYINVMAEQFIFDIKKLPQEILGLVRVTRKMEYLPIFFIDELTHTKKELRFIPNNITEVPVKITYAPIMLGKLRLWRILMESMKNMKEFGFSDNDLDDVKSIFTETTLFFLGLTMFVSLFHGLFDFLAFKNDISYWKKRKTMAGLSFHTVLYRCVSTIIIFLYLYDEKTSLLVLVPAGIGSVIEIWKVTKALKVKVERSGWGLKFTLSDETDSEKATNDYDSQAIKKLSYLLYPLCMCAAIYSLFYVPQKSWYSWIINSLVNAVYAFGFLFMLPQLFINYKLKSVAHLPWRAFMYKAFNTFIDDVFAFIIKMPTSHRLACFRDDIIFFCYLYQLWLYPVDKTRVNEFGVSYEEHEKKE